MSRPSDRPARLTVAGCGTAVPEPDRACSGYFVEAGRVRLLLDCGPGVVHRLARLQLGWQEITHVGDVPMLFFALRHGMPPGRVQPLTVYGPVGVRAFFAGLVAVFGEHLHDPGFPVDVIEVEPGRSVPLGDDASASAHRTPHTSNSIAYRIVTQAGDVGYTGDTGYSEDVADFLAGTSILVAECSLPDDAAVPTHLTPSRLGRMAARAAPAQLVVTHVYPQLDRAQLPDRLRANGWNGPCLVAFDGLQLPVRRTDPT
jgi:ribonuclease BN (tRNA processing enzyme)